MNGRQFGLVLLAVGITALTAPQSGGQNASNAPSGKEALKVVVDGGNRFAFALYDRLSQKEGNLFFSPASIYTALAMTYPGAGGETAAQMVRTLELPSSVAEANAGFSALLKRLNQANSYRDQPAYELFIANALWGQKGYPFKPEYVNLLAASYDAGLKKVDFSRSEAARKAINDWVAEKTRDKIRDIVPRGVINSLTRLVLANAIYFKSSWMDSFNENATKDEPFHLSKKDSVEVPMMHKQDHLDYMDNEDLQLIELPYIWNDISMLLLLPREVDSLAALEKKLSAEKLKMWQASLSSHKVDLSLPKFTFSSEFQLAKILEEMGMTDAFNPAKADFSGIESAKEILFISDVLHKAFVAVDEKGTEAAAATVITAAGAMPQPEEPKVFRADHPFLFLIRHNPTGSILFLGRVANPKG